jgi:hypothetical protein
MDIYEAGRNDTVTGIYFPSGTTRNVTQRGYTAIFDSDIAGTPWRRGAVNYRSTRDLDIEIHFRASITNELIVVHGLIIQMSDRRFPQISWEIKQGRTSRPKKRGSLRGLLLTPRPKLHRD